MHVTGRQFVAAMAFISPILLGHSLAIAQPQAIPQPLSNSPASTHLVEASSTSPGTLASVRTSANAITTMSPRSEAFIGTATPIAGMIEEALGIQTEQSDESASDVKDEEEVSAKEDFDPKKPGESLAPLQNRELTTEVNVVNVSLDGIGTGVLSEGAFEEQRVAPMALPDGIMRGASAKCVHWRPSLIAHHPLIFEDAVLERHGHTRWGHLEPIASGAKFYAAILLHPYLNTLNRPWECQYALGHYRPGTCAPVLKNHLPYDARAAAVQGLSTAGLFWAAPLPW